MGSFMKLLSVSNILDINETASPGAVWFESALFYAALTS